MAEGLEENIANCVNVDFIQGLPQLLSEPAVETTMVQSKFQIMQPM